MNTIKLHYIVDGDDFTRAGEASASVKKTLRQLGIDPNIIRKVAIALYEGEINMVIHAHGGEIKIEISPTSIDMLLKDKGKGIENIELAMQEGYSTAPDEVRSLGFGAGMGLSNMKKNTDSMIIDSTVNVGTTVHMIINI
ncbi:ATP-binding protein [Paludicola sp. MB14-C6]|uniref:ATP-binding protein n=1 Tax=Paludihabitans sp. MB14-C6 TaxID=3070656 RepID=UPI0027DE09C0|nr:ATP-binding protein [Paludicola sp. MB14-C6]WMJ23422.1 ATP-binding protein [Paludicola sp. MB14-C6]